MPCIQTLSPWYDGHTRTLNNTQINGRIGCCVAYTHGRHHRDAATHTYPLKSDGVRACMAWQHGGYMDRLQIMAHISLASLPGHCLAMNENREGHTQ